MSRRKKVTSKTPSGLNTFLKRKQKKPKIVMGFKQEDAFIYKSYNHEWVRIEFPIKRTFPAIAVADVEKVIYNLEKIVATVLNGSISLELRVCCKEQLRILEILRYELGIQTKEGE